MSGQHTPTDGTDDHLVQQENELEALASIFGDDFLDLRNKDPWKVARGVSVAFSLRWLKVDTPLLLAVEIRSEHPHQ